MNIVITNIDSQCVNSTRNSTRTGKKSCDGFYTSSFRNRKKWKHFSGRETVKKEIISGIVSEMKSVRGGKKYSCFESSVLHC
ncbi:hypothetical protein PUN28_009399 [Cardiocondyla obscurior]|uniref:Uncharacterized protein n=1 Tax=Cardiocondyla obscurior TaxID=286306 RepID=A0AAW2FRU5_9HYME